MRNSALRFGLMTGVASIIITLILYLINRSSITGSAGWVGLLVFLAGMAYGTLQIRKEQGGYMSFGEAFKNTWIIWVGAALLTSLFTYIMFNFIDTGLEDLQKEAAYEMAERMSGMLGEDGKEAMMESLENQDFGMSFGRTILNFFVSALIGTIPALIVSLFVKKNNPGIA